MLILNTLAPVFLLIAAGAALQATKFVSPGFLKEANRVTYWLGLPALLFSQLAGSFRDASGERRSPPFRAGHEGPRPLVRPVPEDAVT